MKRHWLWYSVWEIGCRSSRMWGEVMRFSYFILFYLSHELEHSSSLRPSAQKRNLRIVSVHRIGWRWDVALFGSGKSWTGKTFILHCGLTGLSFCRQGCLLEDGFCEFTFGSAQNDRVREVLGRVNVFIFEWPTIRESGALSMDYWLMLYVVVLEWGFVHWFWIDSRIEHWTKADSRMNFLTVYFNEQDSSSTLTSPSCHSARRVCPELQNLLFQFSHLNLTKKSFQGGFSESEDGSQPHLFTESFHFFLGRFFGFLRCRPENCW